MVNEQERPYMWLDSILLTAAFTVGIGWAWSSTPLLYFICTYNEFYFAPVDFHANWPFQQAYILSNLIATTLVPPTFMVMLLRLRRPRPCLAFRQPGVMACLAASVVILAELARYPIRQWTLFAELTRLQGDVHNNIVQLPVNRSDTGFLAVAAAVAHRVGEHAGLATLGVLLAFWAARIPATGPSWLDRLGRLIAIFWIFATLSYLARPLPWE